MAKINDNVLFPPQAPVAGSTWIGSLSDGTTVQFTFEGMVAAAKGDLENVVQYAAATGAGQTVMVNTNSGSPDFPGINGGRPFYATIITWPPTVAADFDMIYEVIS